MFFHFFFHSFFTLHYSLFTAHSFFTIFVSIMQIRGKYNAAIIFNDNVYQESYSQIQEFL